MKDQFDAACVKSLVAFKQQGGSGYEWWMLNKSWAKLLMPEDSTTEALNEKHDLADVVGHIDICVESSEVGRRLIEKAQRQVQSDRLSVYIKDQIAMLRVLAIDAIVLEENRQDSLASSRTIASIACAGMPPKISIPIIVVMRSWCLARVRWNGTTSQWRSRFVAVLWTMGSLWPCGRRTN